MSKRMNHYELAVAVSSHPDWGGIDDPEMLKEMYTFSDLRIIYRKLNSYDSLSHYDMDYLGQMELYGFNVDDYGEDELLYHDELNALFDTFGCR